MINVDDLFDYTSFNIDREPHIVLDAARCGVCTARPCTTTCPARCYTWSEKDRKMTFVFAGCLECGTCYVVCEKRAFTRWRYPRGGFGVSYRMT
ncbi:ferredoxin family protein [Anaeromyxobacter oryzae]|uniref:Ferredoxin n=1 Tax=Anaeromyxobacter oryzae TaxID=2918170 RepID=A0ABM7X195_9BACT|nr:4Fe-4S dicluster domain-containing protein [Anaeromyxobacter oryzae]BDG05572.1 ferredoxin [Anaeromyxobacter oryzae]